eukprot:scaffold440037_cov50-Prasinocladus_malaysianus.AAC.1
MTELQLPVGLRQLFIRLCDAPRQLCSKFRLLSSLRLRLVHFQLELEAQGVGCVQGGLLLI